MDTNEEERAKGKTVEVGRAHFDTEKKRYTLLDAPGHKNYVPNMIAGAAQADIGVLIISARKSEFEAGFDRGGQTREHAMLAKTLGISRLVVAINKMDEATVKWSKKRYDGIIKKLNAFLKKYFKEKNIVYLPVSAYTGANLLKKVDKAVCPWYNGDCLIDVLDNVRDTKRNSKAGLRIPIIDRYKDMGTICALGKVEAGTLFKGQKLAIMPTGSTGDCVGILVNEKPVDIALPGENVVIQTKGLDENELQSGFVICERARPCKKCVAFEAEIRITELLPHKPLMTSGYTCILHCHTVVIQCQISKLIEIVDKKKNTVIEKKPKFAKKNQFVNVKIKVPKSIAVETYKDFSQLGRFTLRDEGKTIAIGRILKLKEMKKK
uniref:Tr-type G domain-containing protein n=1 Tax=Lotharella globosa TaxID=91324 RepID=A0A7S3ZDZ0_9EUKA